MFIYLYGMTSLSTMYLLDGPYPMANGYQEIKNSYTLPSGETANTAIVLASLGLKCRIDGPYLGTKTKAGIINFMSRYGIDVQNLNYDMDFEGIYDVAIIDSISKTVLGKLNSLFKGEEKKWSKPDNMAIEDAKIVSIDACFGDESLLAALYCTEIGKIYVALDCEYTSEIHRNAAVTIVSNDFIKNNYSRENFQSLFKKYSDNTRGLVVFSLGSREILYGRRNQKMKSFPLYKVRTKGLGSADTLRAGIIFAILKGLDDDNIIKFAAATSGVSASRFPMALRPPSLEEIMEVVNRI